MSHEITDTSSKFADQDIPDGRDCFKIESVDKKYGNKGGEFFIWTLKHSKGTGQQVLLPNMMGGLLRSIKCDEVEPNKFDWDTFEVVGRCFLATVSHKPDSKDASKVRQHMSEFAEVKDVDIPF